MPIQENPTELKAALWFGLLFAIVLLAVAAAKERLGQGGLYFVAGLSGLTDMDAISLSTAQLVNSGTLGARQRVADYSGGSLIQSDFQGCGDLDIRTSAIVRQNCSPLRRCANWWNTAVALLAFLRPASRASHGANNMVVSAE